MPETTLDASHPGRSSARENGQNADLLVDIRDGDAQRLYIIDLCRTQVLHFDNDVIRGVVESDKQRPEGKRVANWELRRVGQGLLFSGEVFDSEIKSNNPWPFGHDGFNLMFDFRPTTQFAGISVDREVHQTLLNVYDRPFFAIGLRAWSGRIWVMPPPLPGPKPPPATPRSFSSTRILLCTIRSTLLPAISSACSSASTMPTPTRPSQE